jgi:hypothetical protein
VMDALVLCGKELAAEAPEARYEGAQQAWATATVTKN